MKYLPLMLNVSGQRCLIVGGGLVGTRRAAIIEKAGAVIDLVTISACNSVQDIVRRSGGKLMLRKWQPEDIITEYRFIIAATDDEEVNCKVEQQCRLLDIPVNIVTNSAHSDFAFPSVIDRQPITIAVSSGSASPILARLLAERIDALIPAGYGRLASLVGKFRLRVRQTFSRAADRKAFWEKVLRGAVAEHIFSGNQEQAEALLESYLINPPDNPGVGEVYLIGAGPGDPDLLTFRAYRLLQQSQVVLYDRLVSTEILGQISPEIEMIHVGKQRSRHTVSQKDINQLLVDFAVKGLRVARLKGGDPFIFGRGGEEIEQLAAKHIPFQVVPGITAASGCACYSGIPLTHRDHAQSVRFVTGQLQDGSVNLPWPQLVSTGQTVVIYMGLNGLPIISQQLISHGMRPDMPAAMIEQGTTANQKIYRATVATLPAIVQKTTVHPPTLLIIGTVVDLHNSLNWFQQDHLAG